MLREDYFIIPENKKVRNFNNEQILTIASSADFDNNSEIDHLARAVYEEYKGAGVFKGENMDKLTETSKKVTFENIENRLQRDPNTETTHVMLKAKGKNGEMLVTNEYFKPIEIRTSSGKTVRVPRVVGYKEWLKIVENIKRYSN